MKVVTNGWRRSSLTMRRSPVQRRSRSRRRRPPPGADEALMLSLDTEMEAGA